MHTVRRLGQFHTLSQCHGCIWSGLSARDPSMILLVVICGRNYPTYAYEALLGFCRTKMDHEFRHIRLDILIDLVEIYLSFLHHLYVAITVIAQLSFKVDKSTLGSILAQF